MSQYPSDYSRPPAPQYGVYVEHDRLQKHMMEPSRTKQDKKAECDIMTILAQHAKTGMLAHVNQNQGRYEDLGTQMDFEEAVQTVAAAEESFATLPAAVRQRFQNSPAEFLAFVQDPQNMDEMIEMGLVRPQDRPPAPAAPPEGGEEPPPETPPPEAS